MPRPQTLQETVPAFGRVARRFWPHLKSERRLIFISLIALFAEIGLRLLEPWPLKFVFDLVLAPGGSNSGSAFPILASMDAATLLMISAISIVVFTALRAAAAYMNTVGF